MQSNPSNLLLVLLGLFREVGFVKVVGEEDEVRKVNGEMNLDSDVAPGTWLSQTFNVDGI